MKDILTGQTGEMVCNGKIELNIPVIGIDDKCRFYELIDKYREMLIGKFGSEFKKMMKKPTKVPSHIKSVPKWLKYLHCCAIFPMAVILKAKENGLFLKENEGNVPAIFLLVCEG